MSAEPPPPTDAPAPSSDDFDPEQHVWDGTNWWSLDKQRWWDGSRWRSVAAPVDASAAPPPPPQVSPDGKFYWDGQRWLPMQTPAAQVPPPQVAQQPPQVQAFPQQYPTTYAPPKKGHALRNVSLGCLGLIVLLFVIGLAANGTHGPSTPASSPSNSTTNQPSAAPASPVAAKVLLDKTGSGINKTPDFTAAGDWEIDWSYDCSNFGQSGNFQVIVYNSDGSLADVAVNELGAKGSDVTNEHQGGTYYLEMNSECNWHVIVKG